MPSISFAVDDATLRLWLSLVGNLRRELVVPVTVLTTLPGISTTPRQLVITGERLLLDVGRACSRPDTTDDPASLFALLKYASVISETALNLALTSNTKNLGTHKKKVLSDELGCGMAFAVAGALFNATGFLDTARRGATPYMDSLGPPIRGRHHRATTSFHRGPLP